METGHLERASHPVFPRTSLFACGNDFWTWKPCGLPRHLHHPEVITLKCHTGWWFQPLQKIWVRWLGWWHSQYTESHKSHAPVTTNQHKWVLCLPSPNLVGQRFFFTKIPRVFHNRDLFNSCGKPWEFCSSWNRPKTTETFQIPTESVIARRQVSVLLATSLCFKQRRKKHGKITQVLRPPTIRSSKIMGFFNAPLVLWLGNDALETNEKRPGMSTGLKNPSRICPLLVKHFAQRDQKVAELCFHLHSQASQASIYKQIQTVYIYHICTIYYILYAMHV